MTMRASAVDTEFLSEIAETETEIQSPMSPMSPYGKFSHILEEDSEDEDKAEKAQKLIRKGKEANTIELVSP